MASSSEDYPQNHNIDVVENIRDGVDASDFALPTFPRAFELAVPEISGSNVNVRFDILKLHIELDTIYILGATYEINLCTSMSIIGVRLCTILQLGVVSAVDLTLFVEIVGSIYISNVFQCQT
jgi:hypothetical protein